ncbi:alpha/beta fold hydrolase [Lapillicoccus jejuensis]|uniref:Alpha/beta hydrolase family protein n=1 Tax=Lapillicoccus jejuensis TaxID=402171 RepID=A0A542E2T0_9MICO|nr:alpha/beta fold hydrolase [Lapillicoccus jejuensis]TQJ09635.1 alpha/beta hydrolase family protein [Lapillicoccus jejuensis]
MSVTTWGDGDRQAVLIHGLTGGPGVWYRVGPALAERGFRVTAVTLPGHDGRPAPDGWSQEVLVRAVLDQAPPTPYLVVGHSLGGYTLAAALERLRPRVAVHEDPVLDLPAAGAALSAYGEQKAWTREEIARRNPRWRAEAVEAKYAGLQGWDPAICDALVDPGRFPATVVPTAGSYGVLSSAFVLADDSPLVPPAEAERLRGLGHRVDVVDGAGHSVHHDRFEEFMARVDAALDAAVDEPG